MAGTSQVTLLGFLGYQTEASFAAASSAYDTTLQVRDAILDTGGIVQDMVVRGGVFGRPNQGDAHIPGPHQGATLTFTLDLYGHGSTTNTTLSATPLHTLLSHALGCAAPTQVGGALTTTGSTATNLVSTNTTIARGEIVRVGELGDGACEGQATVSDDANDTTPYTLGVALPAAPTDGVDIVYAMLQVYEDDSTTNAHLVSSGAGTNNTLRFVVASGAQQYALTGCACTAIAINGLNVGEVPSITFTWSAAWWQDVNVTFPSATAEGDSAPAPTASGSLFYNAVATTTRVTDAVRNFALTLDRQMIPVIGQGGANANQIITGWVRGKSMPSFSFDVEAQDAAASPTWSAFWNTDPNSIVFKHFLYTVNPTDGRAVALYFPNCRPAGARPTQQDLDGLTYVTVTMEGVEGPTTTNALTRSPWRMGLG